MWQQFFIKGYNSSHIRLILPIVVCTLTIRSLVVSYVSN